MANRIALSDVDGTIVRKSLVLNHAATLHDMGILDLGDLPKRWREDPKNEDLIYQLAEAYREKIVGLSAEDIKVREYLESVYQDDANFYSTLSRLAEMRDEGHEIVLISGSPHYLVEAFASHYGFKGVGSDYRTDAAGRFTGECVGMFSGPAKKKYIRTLSLKNYSYVVAFGDTQSDTPLFDSAHYSVLVEPTHETHEALGSKVHEVIYE